MISTAIPQELIDTIIDLLADDYHALRACAAVCRAWLPRSHLHLFKHISLGDGMPLKFLQLLESSSSLTFSPFVRSLSLHESRGMSPHETKWLDVVMPALEKFTAVYFLAICFVRIAHCALGELEKGQWSQEVSDGALLRKSCRGSFIPKTTFTMAEALKNRSSNILNADVTCEIERRKRALQYSLPNRSLTSTLSGFKTLEYLRLEHINFWTFAQFVEVLNACPHLAHLSLKMISWEIPSLALSVAPFSCRKILAHLKTLEFDCCDVSVLLDWLLYFERAPSLSRFSVGIILGEETALIGAFVFALGESLTELKLEFPSNYDPAVHDAFCRNANLAMNTKLRSLQFGSISLWQPQNLGWMLSILSQISSPMEELEFDFRLTVPSNLNDSINWVVLEDILAKPSWLGLRRISFVSPSGDGDVRVALETLIQRNLPRCADRDILFWKHIGEGYKESWERFDGVTY